MSNFLYEVAFAFGEIIAAILAIAFGVACIYVAILAGAFAYFARQERIRISRHDADRARMA